MTWSFEDDGDIEPIAPGSDDFESGGFMPIEPEPPKSARASWLETLKDVPAAAGRSVADMALGLGPNIANLGSMAVDAASAATGLTKPGDIFDRTYMEPARVTDYTPQGMDDKQRLAHKVGTIATMTALSPAKSASQVAANAGTGAFAGLLGNAVGEATGDPNLEAAATMAAPFAIAPAAAVPKYLARRGADAAALLGAKTELGGLGKMATTRLAANEIEFVLSGLNNAEKAMVVEALKNGKTYIPGAPPNVEQALAQAQMMKGAPQVGSQLASMFREAGASGDIRATAMKGQREAMLDPFERAAGGATLGQQKAKMEGLLTRRTNEAEPLLSKATAAANQTGETVNGLLGDIGPLTATRNNALQQQGQMLTGAAQSGASVVPRPALGEIEQGLLGTKPPTTGPNAVTPQPRGEGQFPDQVTPNPFGLPRIPEDGITGQRLAEGAKLPIGRMAKLKNQSDQLAAADEFGATATKASDSLAEINARLSNLAFDGVAPLKAAPILSSLKAFARDPLALGSQASKAFAETLTTLVRDAVKPDGTIDARTLSVIRTNINSTIRKLMKEAGDADDSIASSLGIKAKAAIDNAITGAGGVTWREGLTKYGELSNKATALRAEQELFALLDEGTPAAFLKATGRGEAAFLKKLKVEGNKSLKDVLGKKAYSKVVAARKQILRDRVVDKVYKESIPAKAPNLKDRAPFIPNTLDPVIGRINFLTRGLATRAQAPTARRLSELGTQPKEVANLIQSRLDKSKSLPYPVGLLTPYEDEPLQFDVKLKGYR